ncbi:MAG: hypothetical protein OXT71_00445 [Acidobacteriota bacterium]|nr:hypothetical protein [Acidobacteriota bacterium]
MADFGVDCQSRPNHGVDELRENPSGLFIIAFVITGIFLLVLVALIYFLFTGQNEEAKSVLSPFLVVLIFIVWRMTSRLGAKR